MSSAPIGVFDSGIGGITVLKELVQAFPNESFIYLGDTARLPYGSKSSQTIRKYSEQNIAFLRKQNVKAVVIACNSASSQFFESEWEGIPVYNVIDPGSQLAVQKSRNKRIGILGTKATILSQAYQNKILAFEPSANVFAKACPLFVPLAEEGLYDDPITDLVVKKYLDSIIKEDVDTIVLGCTHYPLLRDSIVKYCGENTKLISSGLAITLLLKKDFDSGRLAASTSEVGTITICTTDSSEHFIQLSKKILSPLVIHEYQQVDL
jgi:glutamate racemase